MTSLDSSQSNYRFKSVSLGSNEEFVRSYNELYKFPNSSIFCRVILDNLKRLDRLLKRLEKNAHLHEVLAGIVHLIDQIVSPALRKLISDGVCSSFDRVCFLRKLGLLRLFWRQETRLEELIAMFTNSVASGLDSAYNVVVSAVVLLALVYQYLLGCVDKGGSKTYSSGSLDFRDSFVCIVLFRGAYVWIKFRQAACPANRPKRKSLETPHQASPFGSHDESLVSEGGVYRRAVRDKSGAVTRFKYEPRFKPPRERLDSGTTLKFDCLSLGSYDTDHEARIVRQIAAFYYGKELEGHVLLEDCLRFPIPSMSEQEKSLSGKEKAKWVTSKTKAVYADLQKEKRRERVQLLNPALWTNSLFGGATTDPIQSVQIEACAALGTYSTELTVLQDADPSFAPIQFGVSAGFAGFEDMIAELWANDPAPQSSGLDKQMHTGGFTDIVAHRGGCLPQFAGSAAQDLEHGEPQLTSHPMESPHGQLNHLQQLMTSQSSGLDNQMHTGGFTEDVALRGGCLPQADRSAAQDLEHGEPQLTRPPMDSLHGELKRLQELVARYQNKLQDVQHQLMESEVQKSNFEQQLMGAEVKNSELQCEVANLTSKLQCITQSQFAKCSEFPSCNLVRFHNQF